MTADLQKNVAFGLFSLLQILRAEWVNYYILGVLISYYNAFWRAFEKLKKTEVYDGWGSAEKCLFFFFYFSHFWRFCSQMSGLLLHFRCPAVIFWWLPVIVITMFDISTTKIQKFTYFDEKYENCENSKNSLFFCRSTNIENLNFVDFLESLLQKEEHHHCLTSGQPKSKNSRIWMKNILLIYKSLRFFQYKCIWPTQIGKQIWPWRQKGQMSTQNHHLSNFGRSPVPVICAKIRTQGLFGYGEEDF